MKRFLMPALVLSGLCFVGAVAVQAGAEGRLAGTVQDPDGNPLENVLITVRAINYDVETTRTSNKKGRFTLLVMDATKDYTIRIEKEGFAPIEEPFDPPLGDTMRKTWTLFPGGGGAAAPAGIGPEAELGPAETSAKGAVGRKYEQGMEAFQADDLVTAQARFQEVIELEPELPEAHTALALVWLRQDAFGEALAASEKVLELRPDDIVALKIQFESYKGLGNTEMEEVLLDKLIVMSPDEDLARLAFNMGVSKIKTGDLAAGAAWMEQARDMAPHLLPIYSALARVYFDLERYDDAIAMSTHYLEVEPGAGDVLGVLYLSYDKKGMIAEAEQTFEALKATDSTHIARVMLEMGVASFNAGNIEQAKDMFERILAIEPEDAKAHYHLGVCYVSMGDTARGKEMLSRFVELAPEDPDAAVAREMIATL